MLADGIARVTEAQLAFALDDEEHLLFAVVAVERTLKLARRQDRKVVAKLLGSDVVYSRCPTPSFSTIRPDGAAVRILKPSPVSKFKDRTWPRVLRQTYLWFADCETNHPLLMSNPLI